MKRRSDKMGSQVNEEWVCVGNTREIAEKWHLLDGVEDPTNVIMALTEAFEKGVAASSCNVESDALDEGLIC